MNLWLGIGIEIGKVVLFVLKIILQKIYLELKKPPIVTHPKGIQVVLRAGERLY